MARRTRITGRQTQERVPAPWRWNSSTLKVVDGTTVSLPDTPANQKAFPQHNAQQAGVAFPIARMVVLFSLAVGTVLDAALGRYQGKRTGETALFHDRHAHLEVGDLLLADRGFSSYWEVALVRQRGVHLVSRLHPCRRADFRTGRRLGREDPVVQGTEPARPDWMAEAVSAAVPTHQAVRQVRVRVRLAGFRVRVLVGW